MSTGSQPESSLAGKQIVLGVSGGIAAYKAVLLCRRLVDAGAHVLPVMTSAAQRFVGKATFDALASEPTKTSIFDDSDPIPHTTLGQRADLVVVAPATARLIGSYAAGISDGLLTATLLATRAPVVVCPAMHTEMWEHPAVQDNLALLAKRGVHIVAPAEGRLAGGDEGAGRLAEPTEIFEAVRQVLDGEPLSSQTGPPPVSQANPATQDLAGKSVVVTAGGTREAIDPVRFVGNRSSGRQGHALAMAAWQRGAAVTLITTAGAAVRAASGGGFPADIQVVEVESAAEMAASLGATANPDTAAQSNSTPAEAADLILMAAAVADFRPTSSAPQKIKKGGGVPEIKLEPTIDILATLGARKPASQVLVGFAAETEDIVTNATKKLESKNLDLIVLNDVSAPGVGFEHDTNAVTILRRDGSKCNVPLSSKLEVAHAVLDEAAELLTEYSVGGS